MCTVTYLPGKELICLTAARSNTAWQDNAPVPVIRSLESGSVIFAQSTGEEGSWIAAHENGNVIVLMDKPMASTPPVMYRKSRRMLLLDLIDHFTPLNCFLAVNLNNIKPFTAIIRDNRHLFACHWSGHHKTYDELDPHIPQVWSAAGNDEGLQKQIAGAFQSLAAQPGCGPAETVSFHRELGIHAAHISHLSVVCVEISGEAVTMSCGNAATEGRVSMQLRFDPSVAGNF